MNTFLRAIVHSVTMRYSFCYRAPGVTFRFQRRVSRGGPGNTYANHGTAFINASQFQDNAFNNANDAGTWTVTVINPGNISSNTYTFTVK